MKLFIKMFLYVISYVLLFLIIAMLLPGSKSANSNELSTIEIAISLFIPFIILFTYSRIIKLNKPIKKHEKNVSKDTPEFLENYGIIIESFKYERIPVLPRIDNRIKHIPNEKKSREIADGLLNQANNLWNTAIQTTNLSSYFGLSVKMVEILYEASKYEKKANYNYYDSPTYYLEKFYKEVQWKMRDAIEREADYIIQEINGPQRNNKKACCNVFFERIERHADSYSDETYEFANEQYYRVVNACGFSNVFSIEVSIMDKVDSMEGIEFEYFCCELLEKNGFEDVSTTRTSGDQGIDILATKDDIKYAIQCKCYSKDLGNKPVQEAFAGKSIYSCQVAAVMTNRYFTQGGKDAANATGVLLWDRDKLVSFIDQAYIDREKHQVVV